MKKSDNFKLLYRERNIIFKYLSRILWVFSISLLVYVLMTILAIRLIVVTSFWNIMEYPIEIGSFSMTLSNIALFFIIIWVSMILARFIQTILRDEVLVRAKFDRGLPATISMLVRYSIITIGFFIALSAMGFEFSQLTVILGALSVGIGFGLQNIFNNLVSGLILIFERPIHIDDTIEVNNMVGQVRSIGIRTSNVRTLDGAEVIIPNGLLISNEVINWTLSDKKRRIEVNIGVAYGSDVKKVTKLLYEVVKRHEEAIDFPPPLILFDEFADSSLNFRILFWTDNYGEWLRIRSDILFAVNDILEKENIVIPFPQRDVHMYPKQ
jgi:small-conductance mechanosensitive channel